MNWRLSFHVANPQLTSLWTEHHCIWCILFCLFLITLSPGQNQMEPRGPRRRKKLNRKRLRIGADFGQGIRRSTFQWKKRGFQWKGGRDSVNKGFGKAFYRKGNSVKRSGPFSPKIEKLLSKSTSQKSAPTGLAPANQTKERAKTKSSWISPIFVNSGVFPWENKHDSHRSFVPRDKFMNWPFFGLVCRCDSWEAIPWKISSSLFIIVPIESHYVSIPLLCWLGPFCFRSCSRKLALNLATRIAWPLALVEEIKLSMRQFGKYGSNALLTQRELGPDKIVTRSCHPKCLAKFGWAFFFPWGESLLKQLEVWRQGRDCSGKASEEESSLLEDFFGPERTPYQNSRLHRAFPWAGQETEAHNPTEGFWTTEKWDISQVVIYSASELRNARFHQACVAPAVLPPGTWLHPEPSVLPPFFRKISNNFAAKCSQRVMPND